MGRFGAKRYLRNKRETDMGRAKRQYSYKANTTSV